MDFDKSKVYTALNADELKVGSKVMTSNNLNDLMYMVVNDVSAGLTLRDIKSESNQNRFEIINEYKEVSCWNLAYLISEPEEKKLKWTDLKVGDVIKKKDRICIVTLIESDDAEYHILAGGVTWLSDNELKEWKKVED